MLQAKLLSMGVQVPVLALAPSAVGYCCKIETTFFGEHYSSRTTENNALKIGINSANF
jgi:hypothetical protein